MACRDDDEVATLTLNRPAQMLRSGGSYLGENAASNTRLPMGHPEGYLEAFANLYLAFAGQVRARAEGMKESSEVRDCPGITEAIRGMQFIESAVKAARFALSHA